MPTYNYRCTHCLHDEERVVPVKYRKTQSCSKCCRNLTLLVAAPLFRFKGVVTKGGGPDKFTADMLGIPLKELPAGLRTTAPERPK